MAYLATVAYLADHQWEYLFPKENVYRATFPVFLFAPIILPRQRILFFGSPYGQPCPEPGDALSPRQSILPLFIRAYARTTISGAAGAGERLLNELGSTVHGHAITGRAELGGPGKNRDETTQSSRETPASAERFFGARDTNVTTNLVCERITERGYFFSNRTYFQ